jgi:phosphoenolpyruvate synthase/pyruvate phosphate dikinase
MMHVNSDAKFIKSFIDITKGDVAIAGGKGASLGELTRHGIPVPPGFVLLSSAFENFLERTNIKNKINSILNAVVLERRQTIENASQKIQSLILEAIIPSDILDQIEAFFKQLDTTYVAVRSSATAEDSADAAWAGQLETYLNTTKQNLITNIKKCWASLFSPRAIFYRLEKVSDNQNISVAVVVQKMVESDISGTAFTVHPITEDYDNMVIEAGYGLGEAIVGGLITPDNYIIKKSEMTVIEKNISMQSIMIVRTQEETREQMVPEKLRKLQKLNDDQIIGLAKICSNIEKHYGFPCDIEWALEKGKVYITQSRPITTLTPKNKKLADTILKNLKPYALTKHISYSFIPVICFESSCKCYVGNPYISKYAKEKHQNSISILDKTYEVWGDWSKRYMIKSKEDANEIIEQCNVFLNTNNKQVETLLQKEYQKLSAMQIKEILLETDRLLTNLYHLYIFFIDECFEIEDEHINSKLPDVRMDLSNCASKLYKVCDKLIETLASIFKDVPWRAFTFATVNEIVELIEDPQDNLRDFSDLIDRPIVFATLNNSLSIYTGQDALEIKNYIKNQIPSDFSLEKENCIKGTPVYKGKVIQKVIKILEADYANVGKIIGNRKNYVLVTPMTRPEIVSIIKDAAAIITDEGGITCHAAIVARELEKPCIVGTKVATQVLKDGDLIEADAFQGIVRLINSSKNSE